MNETSKYSPPLILFDGVCNLCNASVQFILKHEKEHVLQFASLQQQEAAKRLAAFESCKISDSVLLIEKGKLYQESTAALRIARYLKGYNFFYIFIIIPSWIRDPIYRYIARKRYSWFGKRDECMLPQPHLKHRFL